MSQAYERQFQDPVDGYTPLIVEGTDFHAITETVAGPMERKQPLGWRFERVTDDAFFISVESWDPRFDPQATANLLEQAGATRVELIDAA